MRIGMMADIYKPHISGVTSYIELNKRMLERSGHEVFVFTFGGSEYKDEESNVIRSPGIPIAMKGYSFNLRYPRPVKTLLQTMDVVHVHHPFISGSLALLYCKPKNIPVVFTNHTRYDLYAQAYVPVFADVLGDLAMGGYLPAFARQVDLVISPSAGMRDVLIKSGVDAPIDVVPNGINLDPFRQDVQPISRSELGFSSEDTLLIFVGRLAPEKNLEFLLKAFSAMWQAYPAVGLVLVGDGPARKELEALTRDLGIQRQVFFTGLVPHSNIPCYLVAVDAFATASVTEVHPFTVIEAMAAGKPVLGIQSPGVGDTVQDGRNGYLAPGQNLAVFTAKMVRLVIEHEQRRRLGEQARIDAELYSIDRTNQMMIERYVKVIENAGGRKISSKPGSTTED